MAKHIGIVACSAEGAALCYRTICLEGAHFLGRHEHPEISMHTYPLGQYMRHVEADDWRGVADLMISSAKKLAQIGAELLICPDNTLHQAFDFMLPSSPLPWLHIAEEVAKEAQTHRFKRLALLGTKFLMEGPVYPSKLASREIEVELPTPQERVRINDTIFDELVNGRFLADSRRFFVQVIERLKTHGCDAAILGC